MCCHNLTVSAVCDQWWTDWMHCTCSFVDHVRRRTAAPVQHPLLSVPREHRLCQQSGSRQGPVGGQHERDRRGPGGRHRNWQTGGSVEGDAPQTAVQKLEMLRSTGQGPEFAGFPNGWFRTGLFWRHTYMTDNVFISCQMRLSECVRERQHTQS